MADGGRPEAPPGQKVRQELLVKHYGPVPRADQPDGWAMIFGGAVLAIRLNGESLTPEHGFPIRLIVPHRYAYKGPKWFRGWEYLAGGALLVSGDPSQTVTSGRRRSVGLFP